MSVGFVNDAIQTTIVKEASPLAVEIESNIDKSNGQCEMSLQNRKKCID